MQQDQCVTFENEWKHMATQSATTSQPSTPPTSPEYINTTHEKEIIVDEMFSKIAQLNPNNNAQNLYFNC